MLEVIALNAEDARLAEAGGAHQIELVGTMDKDGLSPSPETVREVLSSVTIPVYAMLRLQDGFETTEDEIRELKQLRKQYQDLAVAGVVVGFLDPNGDIDAEALTEILGPDPIDYTFHRAIDFAAENAWDTLMELHPARVLTAGSPKGVGEGLETLIAKAAKNADRILAGGGLREEHIPDLKVAGIKNFHIGTAARVDKSFDNPIDPDAVARWVQLTS